MNDYEKKVRQEADMQLKLACEEIIALSKLSDVSSFDKEILGVSANYIKGILGKDKTTESTHSIIKIRSFLEMMHERLPVKSPSCEKTLKVIQNLDAALFKIQVTMAFGE